MTKRECCFFGCLPQALYGRGITLRGCGFSSDLDQNRAVFWSKSELETPETPETLETLLVMWAWGCVGAGELMAGELVAGELVGRFFWRIR